MEWLRNLDLKRAFYWMALCGVLAGLALGGVVYGLLGRAAERYPSGGVAIRPDGVMVELEQPTPEERRMADLLYRLRIGALIWLPSAGLGLAGNRFYRWKLKPPIAALQAGTERIRNQDLDFVIPEISGDELGQVCAAFEAMRSELLKANQELWRQTEERRRLNAAFAHDLRNPVTVLKGTVKQLRRGEADPGALERLETYILRIERYVEAMSGVQRLEELRVERKPVSLARLRGELEETAALLAPELTVTFTGLCQGTVELDHGLFLTVAENLIGNAARFARSRVTLTLTAGESRLCLAVEDDGPGFPAELEREGPRPFGKLCGEASHFGMGLYTSRLLCQKHGGELRLQNCAGALAVASFEMDEKS